MTKQLAQPAELMCQSAALSAQLTVYRDRAPMVRDVTVEAAQGAALAIVGRNGAGKTTLLHGLAGLLPTQGRMALLGQDMTNSAAHVRARAGMALVPQGRRLVNDLTVTQNLRSAHLAPKGRGPQIDPFDLFPDLAAMGPRRAGLLSGGQQQQVAVARALLRQPSVLLLDEPTEGLSPALVKHMVWSLDQLRNAGMTLLVAEQRLDIIEQLCSHTLVLSAGELVAAGRTGSSDIAVATSRL